MAALLDIVVLAVHLLCVNLACGGPMVAAWLDWRGVRGDGAAAALAVRLGRAALHALAVGAVLGIVVAWLKWDANYRALWNGPLRYKLHWGAVEGLFSAFLLVGWCSLLPKQAGGKRWAAIVRSLVAVVAASNLLYHVPFLMSVAARLHRSGEVTGEVLRGAAFRRIMLEGQTPALVVHVALASVAVAGVALLMIASRRQSDGSETDTARLVRYGAWWALVPSLAQLPVGLWVLSVLPADVQAQIMGNSTVGIIVFLAALGAALWLLSTLANLALGEISPSLVRKAALAMFVTVVLMSAVQHLARRTPAATSALLSAQRAAP